MMESGSAFSSSGNEQKYNNYCWLTGTTTSIYASKARTIPNGIGSETSKGMTRFDFSMGNLWMSFHIHIVTADVPIIFGIQDVAGLGLYFNSLTNKVIHPASGFSVPKTRLRVYAYTKWDDHIQIQLRSCINYIGASETQVKRNFQFLYVGSDWMKHRDKPVRRWRR